VTVSRRAPVMFCILWRKPLSASGSRLSENMDLSKVASGRRSSKPGDTLDSICIINGRSPTSQSGRIMPSESRRSHIACDLVKLATEMQLS